MNSFALSEFEKFLQFLQQNGFEYKIQMKTWRYNNRQKSVLKLKGHKSNISCSVSRPVTRGGFFWLLLCITRAGRSRLITWTRLGIWSGLTSPLSLLFSGCINDFSRSIFKIICYLRLKPVFWCFVKHGGRFDAIWLKERMRVILN